MFCSSCGTKIFDGEYFCTNCGKQAIQKPSQGNVPVKKAAVQSVAYAKPVAQVRPTETVDNTYSSVGMTTEDEVMEFFETELNYAEKYLKKYRKYVPQLIEALMPGEYISYAFVAAQNISTHDNGGMHGYALTNRRLIVSYPTDALYEFNAAMKGKGVHHGIESFTYAQIVGVSRTQGLLMGNITINFNDGSSGVLNVDKPWTEKIYKAVYNAMAEFGPY